MTRKGTTARREKAQVCELNLILAGVGGQGTVFAGRLLSECAMRSGHHVLYAESHGMARRGGAVVTTLRFGDCVHTPQIAGGRADMLVGFEPMETLRNLHLLNPEGVLVMNRRPVVPPSAFRPGRKAYPPVEEIEAFLSKRFRKLLVFDATELAESAGSALMMNLVMLGAVSAFGVLPIPEKTLKAVISENLRGDSLDAGLRAFELGRKQARGKSVK